MSSAAGLTARPKPRRRLWCWPMVYFIYFFCYWRPTISRRLGVRCCSYDTGCWIRFSTMIIRLAITDRWFFWSSRVQLPCDVFTPNWVNGVEESRSTEDWKAISWMLDQCPSYSLRSLLDVDSIVVDSTGLLILFDARHVAFRPWSIRPFLLIILVSTLLVSSTREKQKKSQTLWNDPFAPGSE